MRTQEESRIAERGLICMKSYHGMRLSDLPDSMKDFKRQLNSKSNQMTLFESVCSRHQPIFSAQHPVPYIVGLAKVLYLDGIAR